MAVSISCHVEHIGSSSAKPPRFLPLFGIGGFAVNFLANQLLGIFGEAGGNCAAQLLKLWPEDLLDKAPGTLTMTVCRCIRR